MTMTPDAARSTDVAIPPAVRTVLVTGAGGEMGHALLESLAGRNDGAGVRVVALDLRELEPAQREWCHESVAADIRDGRALDAIFHRHEIDAVFHLAAVLSSGGERNPQLAHEVNVGGTWAVMQRAIDQAERTGRAVRFILPSTVAVHGLPDAETKRVAGAVDESQWCVPTTMYGCNKLYAEHLGRYASTNWRALDPNRDGTPIDFRAIRFPGIISADTVPSGGTSDFGPEMIHAAAQGKPYECFVREDARIPFMTMPEAVEALLTLADVPDERLTQRVYAVRSFTASAGELAAETRRAFPDFRVTYAPHPARQAIVDSWPADMSDAAARRDWNWTPRWTMAEAFAEYLVPVIRRRYAGA